MLVLTMRTLSPGLQSEIHNRVPLLVSAVATIGVRVFINNHPTNSDQALLVHTMDVFLKITYFASLITNVLGTGIISLKAWYVLGILASMMILNPDWLSQEVSQIDCSGSPPRRSQED